MNIEKINLMPLRQQKNTFTYNKGTYVSNPGLTNDTVSFTGKKKNNKLGLASRVAIVATALSTLVGCTPAKTTNKETTPAVTLPESTVSLHDRDYSSPFLKIGDATVVEETDYTIDEKVGDITNKGEVKNSSYKDTQGYKIMLLSATSSNVSASQAYDDYVVWQREIKRLVNGYDILQSMVTSAHSDNKKGLNLGARTQKQYDDYEAEINLYKYTNEADYEDRREGLSTFDVTYEGAASDGYNLLARGHVSAADKNGDSKLSFGEFVTQDRRVRDLVRLNMDALNSVYYYIQEALGPISNYSNFEEYETAIDNLNLNDITTDKETQDLLKMEYREFVLADKDEDTDGLLSVDELENYYYELDGRDGVVDGNISADTYAEMDGTEIPRGDNSFAKMLGYDSYAELPQEIKDNIKADKEGNIYFQISNYKSPQELMKFLFPNDENYSSTKYQALMKACDTEAYPYENIAQLPINELTEFVQANS